MKGYEIWNSDFIRAKRNGLPLVDKSGFIRELVELNVSVNRIIRLNGFGKTMNPGHIVIRKRWNLKGPLDRDRV